MLAVIRRSRGHVVRRRESFGRKVEVSGLLDSVESPDRYGGGRSFGSAVLMMQCCQSAREETRGARSEDVDGRHIMYVRVYVCLCVCVRANELLTKSHPQACHCRLHPSNHCRTKLCPSWFWFIPGTKEPGTINGSAATPCHMSGIDR